MLIKWFPGFVIPYFLIFSIKSGKNRGNSIKGIAIASLLCVISTVPFLLINYQKFIISYSYHFSREIQAHSFVYYVDAVSRQFFPVISIGQYSLIALGIVEITLLIYYYHSEGASLIILYYFIFFSVFFFVVCNKIFSASYIIWLTPFLAIFLMNSRWQIFLFYLIESIIYIETPLLYRIVYGSGQPYYVLENNLPSISFIFYTVKFLIFLMVFLSVFKDFRNISRCHDVGSPKIASEYL
jgi:hypothetical protein